MSKVSEKFKQKWETGVNQALKVLGFEKPHIYFNSYAQILDCSESFVEIVKINKNNILATRLSEHLLNNQFIAALKKAETEGISIFRGNVMIGNSISPVFLEAAMMKTEAAEQPDKKVICLVLEINLNDTASESIYYNDSSVPSITTLNSSISLHGIDGSALYISPSTESLFGYSCAELNGMNSLDMIYPEDLHIVKKSLELLNTGIDHMNTQYRMVHKNGSLIHVDSSSYLISDVNGQGKHIVNITRDLSSQGKIERALHRSEQKYFSLVMNLPTGISLISTSGELLEVNNAMKKIMGLSLNTPLPEMNFFDIEAMKRIKIMDQFTKCIETKEIVNGEITIKITRKNRGKYLSYSFVPVFKSNHEVGYVIGYVSDLTQQMKSEIESREHAEFLNLVINAIKSPFFVKDQEHKWVILNDAAVLMMGQSREALTGKSDYDLYSSEQADIFWKYDEQVFETGSSSNEEQITWSDGKLHTIVTYKQLYIEKSSGKKFIIGTIHDVSEYKKIEEELRSSVVKYQELFDNANDFIITMDLEGNITNANRTLLNYMQTDLEEFLKHKVYDFITDENHTLANAYKDKIIEGTLKEAFELESIGLRGEPVTYEVKASLIVRNNVPVGFQCLFSDITKRKEAGLNLEKYARNLIDLNKTKDKFFSIIAHDLRNPYSSMIGFSEMLLEDLEELPMEEIRDSIKIIHTSAKNSFNLLDNLLAWSRLETGHMPFTPSRIVLTEAAEEVINVLFSIAYHKKIEINNQVKLNTLLYADKNMLNTILNNLIMNAIKFTASGGEINITAGEMDLDPYSGKTFVKISVADTGIGMDNKTLDMLFTSQKLQSQPGTEKEQGSGLGILLTREMIEKHGGSISAQSTQGEGSVFSFLIPAYNPDDI